MSAVAILSRRPVCCRNGIIANTSRPISSRNPTNLVHRRVSDLLRGCRLRCAPAGPRRWPTPYPHCIRKIRGPPVAASGGPPEEAVLDLGQLAGRQTADHGGEDGVSVTPGQGHQPGPRDSAAHPWLPPGWRRTPRALRCRPLSTHFPSTATSLLTPAGHPGAAAGLFVCGNFLASRLADGGDSPFAARCCGYPSAVEASGLIQVTTSLNPTSQPGSGWDVYAVCVLSQSRRQPEVDVLVERLTIGAGSKCRTQATD